MGQSIFGKKLKTLRRASGLSLRDLAEAVGVSFTYLSKIENGVVAPPSKDVIRKIAKALKVDSTELLAVSGKEYEDVLPLLKNRGAVNILKAYNTLSEVCKMFGTAITRKFIRVATPVLTVIAIAASLVFAAPLPVKAVRIDVTNVSGGTVLSNGYYGYEYVTKVVINVEDKDKLPISRVDVKIVNTADSSKMATLADLPLWTVSKQSHTLAEGAPSGTAAVMAVADSNWAPANASPRIAYGYGYMSGSYGYVTPAPSGTWGYGYGYGTLQGDTSITYYIYWTSPMNAAWAGTYSVQPVVYTEGTNANKAFTIGNLPTFTLSQYVATGGAAAPATVTTTTTETSTTADTRNVVTASGTFTTDVTVTSPTSQRSSRGVTATATLRVPRGIRGTTAGGRAITTITVSPLTPSDIDLIVPPAPPAPRTRNVFLTGFDFVMSDSTGVATTATFDGNCVITMHVDTYPAGVSPDDVVGVHIRGDGTIEERPTRNIGNGDHEIDAIEFSKYALMVAIPDEEEEEVPVVISEPVVEEEEDTTVVVEEEEEDTTVVEEEEDTTPVTTDEPVVEAEEEPASGGMAWWVWLIIGIAIVAVVVVAYIYWLKPRMAS